MIDLKTVKWLQIEASSKCNAWCPGCSRNKNGYELADDLVIEDLKTERFAEVLAMMPNLEVADFCGTFGDAIAASNIVELTELAKAVPEILVRTNGSLRNEDWWRDYAKQLAGHKHNVWFCLDGLEDTHHIYRQGTDWQKIIRNATAFIEAGGYATWQFIPWAHNEHQIKDCLRLSQKLGFKKFELYKRVRTNFSARDYRTGAPVNIQPWSRNETINPLTFVKTRVETKDCMHLAFPSMYLNASGKLNVCCFFNKFFADEDPSKLMDITTQLANTDSVHRVCMHHCGSNT
jgi:sulfatase maturation enzyme AslB (radical SAM superfamily)